jgi:hypothetical protein
MSQLIDEKLAVKRDWKILSLACFTKFSQELCQHSHLDAKALSLINTISYELHSGEYFLLHQHMTEHRKLSYGDILDYLFK